MGRFSKSLALILTVIIAISSLGLMMVKPAYAQSIPKPSVPEFTLQLLDSSYTTPITTAVDPYTGQTITHPSQEIDAKTIEITIKNVPFTPFEITNGSNTYTAEFCYNIRYKGHFEKEWHEAYNPNVNGLLSRDSGAETIFSRQGEYSNTEGLKITTQGMYTTFPINAQIDFQVEAMIGYIHHVATVPFSADVFEGQTSGWSNTQTVAIPEASTSASPTPSLTVPEFPLLVILPLFAFVLCFTLILKHRKTLSRIISR